MQENTIINTKIAADNLLSTANDMLQSALVPGSCTSVPDGDGENGLLGGSVNIHHYLHWQVEFL